MISNLAHFISSSKLLSSVCCFVGGYALSSTLKSINSLAVKYLNLPIDLLNGDEYEEFVYNNFNEMSLEGIQKERLLRSGMLSFPTNAVCEEFMFRFLVEKKILTRISSHFMPFSATRVYLSSLLYATMHLANPPPRQVLVGLFLNGACLGAICSIAQQRIGLMAAIFIHLGSNLHEWRYRFNQSFVEMWKALKEIHFGDNAFSLSFQIGATISTSLFLYLPALVIGRKTSFQNR